MLTKKLASNSINYAPSSLLQKILLVDVTEVNVEGAEWCPRFEVTINQMVPPSSLHLGYFIRCYGQCNNVKGPPWVKHYDGIEATRKIVGDRSKCHPKDMTAFWDTATIQAMDQVGSSDGKGMILTVTSRSDFVRNVSGRDTQKKMWTSNRDPYLDDHDMAHTVLPSGENEVFFVYTNLFGEYFSSPLRIWIPNSFFPPADDPRYCLHGDGLIEMYGGTEKPVRDVSVGDEVLTIREGKKIVSKVCAKVRNLKLDGKNEMVRIGKALLTPGHPVKFGMDVWKRAKDFPERVFISMDINEVFNFVIESRSSIFVDGLEVSTLGQFCYGIDEQGSFFGSELVVEELMKYDTWPDVTVDGQGAFLTELYGE